MFTTLHVGTLPARLGTAARYGGVLITTLHVGTVLARLGTAQPSLVFGSIDYLFFDKVAQVLSLDNVAISAQ